MVNIDQFLKFFHWRCPQTVCNKLHLSRHLQVCLYTTLWLYWLQDADSDDEWQSLVDATDSSVHKLADILPVIRDRPLVHRLKSRLSSSATQVLDAVLKGASRLRPVLQILCNILTLKWFVLNCSRFLFHDIYLFFCSEMYSEMYLVY